MDRKQQLGNVAFGGAWSEQIEADERLAASMDRLDKAVRDTLYEDLRGFADVAEALEIVCRSHPKGRILAAAWGKALGLPNAGLRSQELMRISTALRAGLGARIKRFE